MATPSIQTLLTDAQQVLNLNSLSEVRATMAAALANANVGTPLNPNLTTQQLWDEFYLIVRQPESDIESIITNQLMKFLYAPPAPGGVGADGQVIFNDGGVLAGDPQFLWNKTTNLLTVTGSATITGDLTLTGGTANGVPYLNASKVVTTSDKLSFAQTGGFFSTTFNINSLLGAANYKGGIVVTEDDNSFSLYGCSGYKLIDAFGYATPNQLRFYASNVEQYRIGASGVFNWYDGAGGTRMTLNSTGLGVGAVPSNYRLYVSAAFASGLNGAYIESGEFNKKSLVVNHTNAAVSVNLFEVQKVGTAQFLVDASGNVGIGVTPSAWSAGFRVIQASTGVAISTNGVVDRCDISANYYFNSGNKFLNATGRASNFSQDGGAFYFYQSTAASGGVGSAITWGPGMTLDASGNLSVGATSVLNGVRVFAERSGGSVAGFNRTTSDGTNVLFYRQGLIVGDVSVTTTGTTFNSTSDYRLKEAVAPLSGGLARVNALKPSIYNWKSNGSTGEGFLAHELAEVVPAAVTGEKDAVNEDGSIKAQSIDMSRIVPILVAAIQELTAEVNALKNA